MLSLQFGLFHGGKLLTGIHNYNVKSSVPDEAGNLNINKVIQSLNGIDGFFYRYISSPDFSVQAEDFLPAPHGQVVPRRVREEAWRARPPPLLGQHQRL